MSQALQTEIASYQFCTLDDTWVEAAHRDISGIATKKPYISVPGLLSSMRLKQNLSFLDSLPEDKQALFYHVLFPKWKAIARPLRLRFPEAIKDCTWMRSARVYSMFYRTQESSLFDWSAALQATLISPQSGNGVVDQGTQLKTDFLRTILDTTTELFLSFPTAPADAVARASEAELPSAALAILEDASQGERQFFQVIQSEVRHKKRARTTASDFGVQIPVPDLVAGLLGCGWAVRGASRVSSGHA